MMTRANGDPYWTALFGTDEGTLAVDDAAPRRVVSNVVLRDLY